MAVGVPVVPGLQCPAAASALGAAGLGAACQGAGAASGVVGSAASHLAGSAASTMLDALSSWVAAAAVWLVEQVGTFVDRSTSVNLSASWFSSNFAVMSGLAALVLVPLLALGVIQAIYRQSPVTLVRTAVVNVPCALLLTAVAVKLVSIGLSVTDALSSAVAGGAGVDTDHFFTRVVGELTTSAANGQSGIPAFVVLIGGLVVVVGAFTVWIELLVRAAAIYVAVLFLPMALASLAWPAISHWCRRLADTLAALVLAKFVIVAVLSLAGAALGGGSTGAGPGTGAQPAAGAFATVLGGAALLLLAALSPWTILRLLPMVEAGAVGHLEGAGRRTVHEMTGVSRGLAHVALGAATARSASTLPAGLAPGGPSALSGVLAASSSSGYRGNPPTVGASPVQATPLPGGQGGSDGSEGAEQGPIFGRSTLDRSGIGSNLPAGAGVAPWAPHEAASSAVRHFLEDAADPGDELHARGSEGAIDVLPRASGGRASARLLSDKMGPVLHHQGPSSAIGPDVPDGS